MSSRDRVKRRSSAVRGSGAFVALFTHNRPGKNVSFSEHASADGEKVYTVTKSVDTVVQLGQPVKDGAQYAIAAVNKKTATISYHPVKLLKFEAKCAKDVQKVIFNASTSARANFSADFAVKTEDWKERRLELTAQMGSTKSIKMREAMERRKVNEETLDEMSKTAFASTCIINNQNTDEAQISLVSKKQSEVLPVFVNSQLPAEVYPLTQFVSDDDVTASGEECVAFLSKTKKELIEAGVPEVVLLTSSGVKKPLRAVAYCVLSVMANAAKVRLTLVLRDLEALNVPQAILQKVCAEYLGEWKQDKKRGTVIDVGRVEKERMTAHLLALAVSLSSDHTIPVTPWAKYLMIPETKIIKTLTAIGCSVLSVSGADAIRLNTLRVARLTGPPQEKAGRPKARARRTR